MRFEGKVIAIAEVAAPRQGLARSEVVVLVGTGGDEGGGITAARHLGRCPRVELYLAMPASSAKWRPVDFAHHILRSRIFN